MATLAPVRPGYLFRGRDITINFTVLGVDMTAPSDWTLRWTLRRVAHEPALVTKAGVVDTETTAHVSLLAADTRGVLPGTYWHFLERTDLGAVAVLSYGWAVLEP